MVGENTHHRQNKKWLVGTPTTRVVSTLVVKGDDEIYTAMAKTVGLPMAIAAKNILLGKIKHKGVCIPVHDEIYNPVLDELKKLGIIFEEKEM